MDKRRILQRALWGLSCTVLLNACTALPESSEALAQTGADRQSLSHWTALDNTSEASYLDELIGAPELDALVAEALAANAGLQQTLLSLKILQAQYRQSPGRAAA